MVVVREKLCEMEIPHVYVSCFGWVEELYCLALYGGRLADSGPY